MTKTAAEKFNIIEKDIAFMKKYHPKAIAAGRLDRHFAAHKLEVYQEMRLDYLKLMGDQVRKYESTTDD